MANALEKDIFRTVAFFSYFTYPLTTFEIWKWQLSPETPRSFAEIQSALNASPWLKNFLAYQDGFWGLYWKTVPIEEQIAERHRRNINAAQKHRKMKRVLALVSRLPWVQGVAICNSLALHHTEPRSDIDLFVLTDDHRVWSTRLGAVLPLLLLRQRPGEAKQDPIDVSFFATRTSMNLESLQLGSDDPYLAWWTQSLIPVYGDKKIWAQWYQENSWAKTAFPMGGWRQAVSRLYRGVTKKWPLPISESFARDLQLKRLPKDLREVANNDTRVVVADHMLKFHKNDRRAEIHARLEEAMQLCENS